MNCGKHGYGTSTWNPLALKSNDQLCFHLTEVINHISILPHVKSISNVRSTHALALELEFVKW